MKFSKQPLRKLPLSADCAFSQPSGAKNSRQINGQWEVWSAQSESIGANPLFISKSEIA